MIVYTKLFEIMKEKGKNTSHIRNEKIIGQETLRKLKCGTGIYEDETKVRGAVSSNPEKKRIIAVDSKAIENLCVWLDCQPNDIMEVIPNTWENADRLSSILNCSIEELEKKLPMQSK